MCVLVDKWEKQTITFEGSPPKSDLIEVKPTHYERMEAQIAHKGAVLAFMKKAEVMAVAPMFYKDRETGKSAIEAYYQKSGRYAWSSDTLYHFEHYNYPLPMEFIEYVLKQY